MPSKIDTSLKASSSLFKLNGGMYVIHMQPEKAGQKLNPVTLSQAPSEGGCVDFFPAEKVVRNTLVSATDCIVVRIKGDSATLMATEFHTGKVTAVKLRVEQIGSGLSTETKPSAVVKPIKSKAASVAVAANETTEEPMGVNISMVGHIQNKGDVVVKNDWLGQPGTNFRLEGFAIKTDGLPTGVNLIYGCKFLSSSYKPQISKDGKYVGTRRKAQGIQSVVFALEGDQAEAYELTGDVAFSGNVGAKITGKEELMGPTGTEHLVGINLKVQPKVVEEPVPEEEDDGLWSEEDIKELFSL